MRSASIVFGLLFSAASLMAQRSTSPAQYFAPPSSEGCPVVFSANRVSKPGFSQAQVNEQSQRPQVQEMTLLRQHVAELEAKRNEAAAKLSQLPLDADPAVVLKLKSQVNALEVELSSDRAKLSQLSTAIADRQPADSRHPIGQNVQISFKQSPAAIVGVDLTVHGVSMSARMTPAAQSLRESDLTEVFHLSGSASQPVLESALRTHRPMVISWVELSRIDYANGTSWQKSSTSQCSAAPSLYVPVER